MTTDYIRDTITESDTPIDELLTDDLYKNAKKHHKTVSSEAMDIGTRTHAAIESYFKDEEFTIDPDMEKPWKAFMKWRMQNNITVTATEQTVWSDIGGGFAGTLDLEMQRKIGVCITDIKAANGIYHDHIVQLSAYWYARGKRTGKEIPYASILRLDKKTGEPEEKIYPAEELAHYFEMFLGLLRYCWAKEKHRLWRKEQ